MNGIRILCGIDFSEGSREALRTACELARKRDLSLLLVHVEEEPRWLGEPEFHLPSDIREVRLAHAKALLQVWKHDAIQQGVRDIDTRLAEGTAWDRLCAIARDDRSIGLVVVGTHGRTGLSRALTGSVAERVVRHAPCSVIVARCRT